ncbi:apoptosis-enhancing nuclease [Sphaeramia orbicularis]|uniref:apoptosis-enhancing nuclease n=1 Tax=Sphaeramia orbicularis TaxID=375764 RepID=UPI00118150D3|nr:apoptosis-enhancing nuclease-like [Sphaeramia orbicularis]
MASVRSRAPVSGQLNNYRFLCKRALKIRALESNRTKKRHQNWDRTDDMKRKQNLHCNGKTLQPEVLVKRTKLTRQSLGQAVPGSGPVLLQPSDPRPESERWEADSGFSSEASPPSSGRSSPSPCPTLVVALDCEMVGTGPRGRHSELARCSVLDYHGNVLYDKYVRPSRPVTDYRTRWSGIKRHHLTNATPFDQARNEVLSLLEGKVVVGHSVYNDFEALDIVHPCHMVRDTCTTRLLSRLAGFPRGHCPSLRVLANKLLNRCIQVGGRGHCSVQDAQAALDLYKLVEGEWEQEMQLTLRDGAEPLPSFASSDHYMHDEYWPCDLTDQSEDRL